MSNPWLDAHILEARKAEHEAVRSEVARIHDAADNLAELLPATGRNKKHIKEIRFHADRMEMLAKLRLVA